MSKQEREETTQRIIDTLKEGRKKKPYRVVVVCKDGAILKFNGVKQSVTTEGTFQIATENNTYIFPLVNMVYCELIGEEDKA